MTPLLFCAMPRKLQLRIGTLHLQRRYSPFFGRIIQLVNISLKCSPVIFCRITVVFFSTHSAADLEIFTFPAFNAENHLLDVFAGLTRGKTDVKAKTPGVCGFQVYRRGEIIFLPCGASEL